MARCLCLAGASIDSKNQEGVAAEVKIIIIIILAFMMMMIIIKNLVFMIILIVIILAFIIINFIIRFVQGCRATRLWGIC